MAYDPTTAAGRVRLLTRHPRSPNALTPTDDLAARLLARGVRTEAGCLEWSGSRDRSGYGSMRVRGQTVRVPRAAYAAFVRPLRDDEHVCHTCDNPSCFDPEHLFAGTHQDNMADMIGKGRRRPDIGYVKGENHPQAKLTAADVRDLRARRRQGATYRELMAIFGVSKSTVGEICTGKHWRDGADHGV